MKLNKIRSPTTFDKNFDQDFAKFETGFRQTGGSNVNTRSSSRGYMKKENEFNFETIPTSENTPSNRKIPHSTKNSMNFIRLNEPDNISPFQTSLTNNSKKFDKLFSIFSDEPKRDNKLESLKQEGRFDGYIFSLPGMKHKEQQHDFNSNGPFQKKPIFSENEEKSKNNRILRSIQTITINLNKEKKNPNYINRPIVQFDNKAELKFDMNYIIESSPTNVRKSTLITLEHLHLERLNMKIEPERVMTIENKITPTEKKLEREDSFFDFKIDKNSISRRHQQRTQNKSQNNFMKNTFK